MSGSRVNILLVEDNVGDARLFRAMLEESWPEYGALMHVERLSVALEKLAQDTFGVVLLDLSLPDSHGVDTVERTKERAGRTPIIVLTGGDDEELAVRAVSGGAQDYLVKGKIDGDGLVRSIRYSIERKRAEWIEQERKSLERALRGMDQVLGAVAHDLRIPLTSMNLTADLLLTEEIDDDGTRHELLESMQAEVGRMTNMVNDMLESARLESQAAKWNWSVVDVSEVCRDALEVVKPWMRGKPIDLSHRVDLSASRMRGDREALRRLVVNLLTNAIKHTSRGSIAVTATRDERSSPQWLQLAVADTGEGMSDEVAAKLGHAFALNSGVVGSATVKGTGLGLAICKSIAAAHGGVISVTSEKADGSTFTAHLRVDLTEAAPIPDQLSIVRQAA